MSVFLQRRNKIDLCNYPYQRDIESRLLLATLTQAEVALLNELFNYSLEIPLADLSHSLNWSSETILQMLTKFAPTKLYRLEEKRVVLDKELRRYYEGELVKFDDAFKPGMEYLKRLLNKVPPYVLPNWYALPRRCDKIFPTILEKYLINPKIYQQYLHDLQFDNPIPNRIIEAVYSSSDFKISASELQNSLSIDSKEFHEWLLLLEFHFACVLSYEPLGDGFREIITPFHEWREYLLFLKNTHSTPIFDTPAIQRTHPHNFGFCEDLTLLLQLLKTRPLRLEKRGESWTLSEIERQALFPSRSSPLYAQTLVEKTLFMHFSAVHNRTLIFLSPAEEWLAREMSDKALSMTRHPIQVEKGLMRVLHCGWVTVEDFMRGFMGNLRGRGPLLLTNLGKHWKYPIPSYNDEERALIEKTLVRQLFEAGVVATGSYQGKACFCVTPFGLSLLE